MGLSADITSSDLEFMYDGGIEQVIAIRFPSVDVSAPVNTAWLLFDVDEADAWQAGQSVVIAIAGELDANSREIVDTGDDQPDADITSRTVTEATTIWAPGGTAIVHEELVSEDVSAIVNEISALPGWAAGNPMTFIFTQVRGNGVRWVESNRNNNGINTPALFWGTDPCADEYPSPCVDDYFGLINLFTGLGCGSLPALYGETVADSCARTINIHEGWDYATGAAAHNEGGNQGSATGAELCPVMCEVCEPTQQGFDIAVGHEHFRECAVFLDHEAFQAACCAGGGCNENNHGVPADFASSCAPECAWRVVPMWEQCGSTLYYDDVQHGMAPPSDPAEMATFYQTCKPVYEANPPPDPDAVILDPVTSSVADRGNSAEEKVATGNIDLNSSDLELVYEGGASDGNEQIIVIVFRESSRLPAHPQDARLTHSPCMRSQRHDRVHRRHRQRVHPV